MSRLGCSVFPAVALALCLVAGARAAEAPGPRPTPHTDLYGDPLPEGAHARLGTVRFRNGSYVQAAALSPDAKILAVLDRRGTIRLWDAATGKELRRFAGDAGAMSLSFSPRDGTLVTTGYGGLVRFWDVTAGKEVRHFQIPRSPGPLIALSADDNTLAVGSQGSQPQSPVAVWEVATGKQIGKFEPLQNSDIRAALSADGKLLATWGQYLHLGRGQALDPAEQAKRSQTVQLWDVAAGRELHRLRDAAGFLVSAAAFAPDGRSLVTANNGSGLTFWDVATGKAVRRLAARRDMGTSFLTFSPDGRTLAAGSYGGVVQFWDAATGRRLGLYAGRTRPFHAQAGFGPDGRAFAWAVTGQSVSLWDVRAGKFLSPTAGHLTAVAAVAFTAGGREVVSASADGTICRWDGRTGAEARQACLKEDESRNLGYRYNGLLLSADARYLLSRGISGDSVVLWDVATGEELCSLGASPSSQGLPVVFSPDGRFAAVASMNWQTRNSTVQVWDVNTGQALRQLTGLRGEGHCVAVAPGGKTLAACSTYNDPAQGNVQVSEVCAWDVATGKNLFGVKAPGASIQSLAFTPDGKGLAVAMAGQGVSLWDAATGKERRLPAHSEVAGGTRLVFSPDGRALATIGRPFGTGNSRTDVQVWEAASGGLRQEFEDNQGGVTCLAFSPDGTLLASGGADTTVLTWDLLAAPGRATEAAGEPEALWSALSGADAGRAYQALRHLVASPCQAVPLLRKHVSPARAWSVPAGSVARWIARLDDDNFTVRRQAAADLEGAGKGAEAALRKALADGPSAEKRRQVERLLEKLDQPGPSPEVVAALQAVEVLERLRTPEARGLLDELSKGDPDARLTQDARAAQGRLAWRPASP